MTPTPLNQHLEIERKWLIDSKKLPDIQFASSSTIQQGYLAVTENGTEVRLRQDGNYFTQTVKSGGTLRRTEYEVAITREIFLQLWPATLGARIEKNRHCITLPPHGIVLELDIYSGSLEGLLIAEIEFPDSKSSQMFTAPDWFGDDVTADTRYKNKNLAVYGRPDPR